MRRTAALLLLITAAAAQAGAPMATEDADVLARGDCEWESTTERVKAAGATAKGWETGIACHAVAGTQAGLRVGRLSAEGASVRSLSLAGKTALLPREGDGFGLTLAWGLGALKLPGQSLRHDSSALALVASTGVGAGVTLHANLGWERSKLADATTRSWAVGVAFAANDQLELLAETYGAQRSKPILGLGLRWSASPAWSLGLMASQSRDEPQARGLLLSAKLAF